LITTASLISREPQSHIQVSIIVPVYNQEKNVATSLARIRKVLDSTLLSYEIVVVDDGSLDHTLEVLRKEERADTRIISYAPNMGKGYAVKTGILQSRGDIVIFIDGDLDITPDSIKDYVKELENCHLVIASKRHPSSMVDAPASRKLLSRAFNLIVRIGTGIRVKDTQSGLKAGQGNVLRRIFKVMLIKRYAFDVELLAIATSLNLNIQEMPIEISLSKGFKLRDILRMFVDVAAVAYRYRIRHWYQSQLEKIGDHAP
jgi:glycosyltransferase involved in cell wall biosynthesis